MNTEDLNTRIKRLDSLEGEALGKSVIYVMSRDQRVNDNHALVFAQDYAIKHKLPLSVIFCLRKSRSRAKEHFEWMIQGLKGVESSLESNNIPFILLIGDQEERLLGAFSHLRPKAVFFDFNPLKGPVSLVKSILPKTESEIYIVDTHNVVPVWEASSKQEFSARTIRPKINSKLEIYLKEPKQIITHPVSWAGKVMKIDDLDNKIDEVLKLQKPNNQTQLQKDFPPGEANAKKALDFFLKKKLSKYADSRNDPSAEGLSDLSPYFHFGQLSTLRVALEAKILSENDDSLSESVTVLLEEMIVRKELSDNFCYYNQNYDSLLGAPEWARLTLKKHSSDPREFVYSLDELENSQTHDPAWNACQKQMVVTGKMHGYMRMYWAKKVLEWSSSPEQAIEHLIYLNDFYSLDGGDPNGYVGILWSVAGVHDRPWGERSVYGTVRSMVYNGLKRKFDIKKYEDMWLNNA